MAYTINLTDGTIFATVPDGTLDTTSSVILIGKNYEGYGDALNENFLHSLENHANTTPPTAPIKGQLWFDSNPTVSVLKVYNGTKFRAIGTAVTATTQPTTPSLGDLWFNSTTKQLRVYTGTGYDLVGPASSTAQGITGEVVTTIQDTVLADHVITKLYVNNSIVAIISKDPVFTPNVAISGFPTISPGIQMSTATPQLIGDATNALALGGVAAVDYLSGIANDTTTGTLGILNDSGLTIGVSSNAIISVNGIDVKHTNATSNGDIIFNVNNGGFPTDVLWVDGPTARAKTLSPLAGQDIVNLDYFDANVPSILSDADIKTQYENNANTNAFTDAEQTKLTGIDASATNDQSWLTGAGDLTVVDFNSAATIESTLTGNVSLTSANLAAGRRVDIVFTASGASRIVTLNAAWRSFGDASPITVPIGKKLILTLTSGTAAESGVLCAAVLEN